jgi:MFS family permease
MTTFARWRVAPELVVLLAGVSGALHVGKLSPALPVLRDALQISLLEAGFLLSMVQLAGMLLGLLLGVGADGFGLRRSMLGGLLLLSAAGAAGGWARDASMLLVLRAFEGLGFLMVT